MTLSDLFVIYDNAILEKIINNSTVKTYFN